MTVAATSCSGNDRETTGARPVSSRTPRDLEPPRRDPPRRSAHAPSSVGRPARRSHRAGGTRGPGAGDEPAPATAGDRATGCSSTCRNSARGRGAQPAPEAVPTNDSSYATWSASTNESPMKATTRSPSPALPASRCLRGGNAQPVPVVPHDMAAVLARSVIRHEAVVAGMHVMEHRGRLHVDVPVAQAQRPQQQLGQHDREQQAGQGWPPASVAGVERAHALFRPRCTACGSRARVTQNCRK